MAKPFRRKKDGTYRVDLTTEARELLHLAAASLKSLLDDGDPATDPAIARLYPAAHPDDPLENLEFERVAHDQLASGRAEDLATLEATADAAELSADEILAWMRVANDLRLVLGVRLDITEDYEPAGPVDPDASLYLLYDFLTWLVGTIVETVPV